MDAQTPPASATQNTTPKPASTNPVDKFKAMPKKQKLLLGGVVLVLVVVIIGLFLGRKEQNKQSGVENGETNYSVNPDVSDPGPKPENAIARVGGEYIFKEDLDIEMANYPDPKDDNTKKMLTEKLVKDSIILQAGGKEKILAINPAVFNTQYKDYGKRISDIQAIEKNVNARTDQVAGGVVSIWFHNMVIPEIGLERAKQIAFEKITSLRERVAKKEITIQQAGDIVKNDSSLSQVDVAYKNNAFVPFTQDKGERITVDGDFNDLIWKTAAGEVTPVHLGHNINGFNNQDEEAFYAFAQVSTKIETGQYQSFQSWYDAQKSAYQVTYY